MNRTATVPKALKLLSRKAYSVQELSKKMGVPVTTAKGVIQRLKVQGRLDRHVDGLGYVRWKANGDG